MIFDSNITLGDLMQIIVLLTLIVGYLKGYHQRQGKLDTLLAKQDIRIENVEKGVDQNCGDIRDLYKTKVDKK